MGIKRVLILGGYGNFGKRIAEGLAGQSGLEIVITGRNPVRAEQVCRELGKEKPAVEFRHALMNIDSPDFQKALIRLAPDLLIHTAGPFQGQDYRVPLACIAAGCHYLDLADDRRFVCDIVTLDKQARHRNVSVISGASSVPGLSSTVVDLYRKEFARLDVIDNCIVPGNKSERGVATIQGILSKSTAMLHGEMPTAGSRREKGILEMFWENAGWRMLISLTWSCSRNDTNH